MYASINFINIQSILVLTAVHIIVIIFIYLRICEYSCIKMTSIICIYKLIDNNFGEKTPLDGRPYGILYSANVLAVTSDPTWPTLR